jgi:hypothetical protein
VAGPLRSGKRPAGRGDRPRFRTRIPDDHRRIRPNSDHHQTSSAGSSNIAYRLTARPGHPRTGRAGRLENPDQRSPRPRMRLR